MVAVGFILMLILVICKRPYASDNLRVALNYSITLINIGLLTLYSFIGESHPEYPFYCYWTIAVLLMFAMLYNGYYYFIDWKNIY